MTLRLLGQQAQRAAQRASTSFGWLSANYNEFFFHFIISDEMANLLKKYIRENHEMYVIYWKHSNWNKISCSFFPERKNIISKRALLVCVLTDDWQIQKRKIKSA